MERENYAVMDYKNVYELFLGKSSHNNIVNHNSKDESSEIGIMQEDFLDDKWFDVPYTLTAAGHYEVGDKHCTYRSKGNFFEIICTVSGRGIVEIDNQCYDCEANTVLLINSKEAHSFSVKKGESWEYMHIHFIPNGVASNVANRAANRIVKDKGIINSCFDKTFTELKYINADSHFLLSHEISTILTEMIRYQFKKSFTSPQKELINRSVEYIHKHYGEKIDIKKIAEDNFVSPYHFIRIFKKYCGIPPYNYLMNYRLNRAQYLFTQQKSVKEVSQACGFTSASSFSRAFYKKFGVSASKYRTEFLENNIQKKDE